MSVKPSQPVAAAETASWRAHSRPFPAVRATRTTLRTGHLLAFAVLYGGHVYGVAREDLRPALAATIVSGGALVALEIYRSPLWPVQIRGIATFVKIGLMLGVALWWNLRLVWLTAAVVIGGITSHMPGRYRYYSVLHRRVVDERQESG